MLIVWFKAILSAENRGLDGCTVLNNTCSITCDQKTSYIFSKQLRTLGYKHRVVKETYKLLLCVSLAQVNGPKYRVIRSELELYILNVESKKKAKCQKVHFWQMYAMEQKLSHPLWWPSHSHLSWGPDCTPGEPNGGQGTSPERWLDIFF